MASSTPPTSPSFGFSPPAGLAKTRAYLIAEALVKSSVRKDENGERYALTEYGQLYIDRRNTTAVTHSEWTPAIHRTTPC